MDFAEVGTLEPTHWLIAYYRSIAVLDRVSE